jgi:signal transduction histidine kinase
VNGIAALRATLDPAAITRFLRQAQGADDATTVVVNRDGRPQMIDLPSPIRGHAGVLAPPHETSSGWAMVDERGLRFGYAYRWLGLTDWALLTVPVDPQRTRSFNDAGLMLGAVSAAFILAGFSTILIRSRTVVRRLKRQDNEQARLSDELHHAARLASVGELAAGIAHEINDPLAIITEEAGLIRDLLDPEISGSGPTEDLLPHLETIRVRDVMVPLDEVPRVRDDESLASAVVALHRARIGGDGHRPPLRLVLVENGDGHVIGRIGHLAFLRSMFETRPFSGSDDAALERANVDTETLRSMSDHLRFLREEILGCCERADFILARDAMVPLDDSVDGSCSLGDGVHLLVTHQRLSVPVRENGKLVGLLRLADVFDHIAVLLESRPATR